VKIGLKMLLKVVVKVVAALDDGCACIPMVTWA
jgi:hypothetical protein